MEWGSMKNRDIAILSSYFLCTVVAVVYMYREAVSFEKINSTVEFVSIPISLLFLLLMTIFSLHIRDNLKNTIKVTMVFFIFLGGTLLVFEVVKPDITYIEAKKIIEEKYNASIVKECPKTIQTMNEKQIYRFFTQDDKTFSFDPYKNEIEQLTGTGFGGTGMCE
jgi:hypothetical protein